MEGAGVGWWGGQVGTLMWKDDGDCLGKGR